MWNCSLHLWNSTLRCRRCLFVNPHPPPPPLVSTEELTSSSSLSPPASASLHPAYLRSGHTLLHPSLLQPGVRAALGRITEGHGSLTCLNTTAKEGVVHICSMGLLFSSREGKKGKKKESLLCQLVFALLFLTCRRSAVFHLQGPSCTSFLKAAEALSQWRGKATAENKPKPFGCSVLSIQARLA